MADTHALPRPSPLPQEPADLRMGPQDQLQQDGSARDAAVDQQQQQQQQAVQQQQHQQADVDGVQTPSANDVAAAAAAAARWHAAMPLQQSPYTILAQPPPPVPRPAPSRSRNSHHAQQVQHQPPPPPQQQIPTNPEAERMGMELASIIAQLQADQTTLGELLHRRAHHQLIVTVNQDAINAIDEQMDPIRQRLTKAASLFRPEHLGVLGADLAAFTGGGPPPQQQQQQQQQQPNGTSRPSKRKSVGSKSAVGPNNTPQQPNPNVPISSADILANAALSSSPYQGIVRFDAPPPGTPSSTVSMPASVLRAPGPSPLSTPSRKRPRESEGDVNVSMYGGQPQYEVEEPEEDEESAKKKRATATPFTEDDKQDMVQYLRVVGPGKTTAKFWQQFADVHPRHTALSWAIYYKRHRAEIEPNELPESSNGVGGPDPLSAEKTLEDRGHAKLIRLLGGPVGAGVGVGVQGDGVMMGVGGQGA